MEFQFLNVTEHLVYRLLTYTAQVVDHGNAVVYVVGWTHNNQDAVVGTSNTAIIADLVTTKARYGCPPLGYCNLVHDIGATLTHFYIISVSKFEKNKPSDPIPHDESVHKRHSYPIGEGGSRGYLDASRTVHV